MNLEQRVYQAGEVLGHLDGFAERNRTKSRVLAGDFNSYPGSVEWNIITERLADAWMVSPVGDEFTSTGANPYQRLDAVFVSRDARGARGGPRRIASPRPTWRWRPTTVRCSPWWDLRSRNLSLEQAGRRVRRLSSSAGRGTRTG